MAQKGEATTDVLYIYVPLGLKKKLKKEALERDVSLSTLVVDLILEQHDNHSLKFEFSSDKSGSKDGSGN